MFLFFSLVDNMNVSATNLNCDLSNTNAWANEWKMTSNPDSNKQEQEVTFSSKIKKTSHPPLNFNNNNYSFKNPWAFTWTVNWTFLEHLQHIFKKVNQKIRLLRKLQNNLPSNNS